MKVRNITLSPTSAMHYTKLAFRSFLFAVVLVLFIIDRVTGRGGVYETLFSHPVLIGVIFTIFAVEILMRFFPDKRESMGCQKQFKVNYIHPKLKLPRPHVHGATLVCLLVWCALNALIGLLYWKKIIDNDVLMLVSLFYSVSDMICILFFCPFQTWILKNKCCTTCRIYNWDFAMMFTPMVLIPHPATRSIFGIAMLLMMRWELTYYLHPERFHEETNSALKCANCTEKLCSHKKQLKRLHKRLTITALTKIENTAGKLRDRIDTEEENEQ